MMASTAVSLSATSILFEHACRECTIEKHSTVLDNVHMGDAPGQSVSAVSIPAFTAQKVNAPVCLQRVYGMINTNLHYMASVIQKLLDKHHDPNPVAPSTVAIYYILHKLLNV